MTRPRPLARKLLSIGVGATTLFAATAFVVTREPTRAKQGGTVVGGTRISHDGSIPSWWLSSTRDTECWDPKAAEEDFVRSTNEIRKRLGRSTLELDGELSQAARKHTREMIDRNLLHHTSPDSLRRRVTFWNLLGENVGVGNSVGSIQDAFMDSPSHRDNIVHGTYRHIGVGTRTAHGRLWVTVLFEARENPGTTLRMPRC